MRKVLHYFLICALGQIDLLLHYHLYNHERVDHFLSVIHKIFKVDVHATFSSLL